MSGSVRFDEDGVRQVPTDAPDGSTLQAIRDASHASGLDPVASLYNDALALAEEGHFGQAQTALQVLLGLAPADGGAHLLLAKIYVAGQQWRRALASLDNAAQCGASVPSDLRTAVVRHLHADDTAADEARATPSDDVSDGELRKLKSETRRLRSENAHLITRTRRLEREARTWGWVSVGTSVIACGFMLRLMSLGTPAPAPTPSVAVVDDGPTISEPAAAVAVAPQGKPVVAAPPTQAQPLAKPSVVPTGSNLKPLTAEGTPIAPVRNADAAALAKASLKNASKLATADLTVVVRAGHAELSGSAQTYSQIREAKRVLGTIPGIDTVGHRNVRVYARTDGASHKVVSGDSLSEIAWDYYGDETKYDRIVAANKSLKGGTELRLGQVLVLPALND